MAETDEGNAATITDLFNEAMHVTSLAHYARVQAHEVDLKARHSVALAERAMCEAASVRQVAESLTHTARAVAKVALEIATGSSGMSNLLPPDHPLYNIQNELDANKEMEMDGHEKYAYFREQEEAEDRLSESAGQKVRLNFKPRASSSYGVIVANTAIQPLSTTASTPIKYTEAFPAQMSNSKETLPKEIDSSHSLPTVWEDSYQGTRECKRVSYTEKKSIRKIQRKLQNIEDEEAEDQLENCERDKSLSGSKEKLLTSVRFSESVATTNNESNRK